MKNRTRKTRQAKAKDVLGEIAEGLGIHDMEATAEVLRVKKLVEGLQSIDIAVPEPTKYPVTLADGTKEVLIIQELSIKKRRVFDSLLQAQSMAPATLEALPDGVNTSDPQALWRLFSVTDERLVEAVVVCCDNPQNVRQGKSLVTKEWIEENLTETDVANIMNLYGQRHIPALLARVRSLLFTEAARLTMMPGVSGQA